LRPDTLREITNTVWGYVAGEKVPEAKLANSQERIEALIPDLDDSHAPENASLILSAAGAVAYAVRSCISETTTNARAAGTCAIEAVHEWVGNLLHPGLSVLKPAEITAWQRSIDQHPLMIRELDHVQTVMQFLSETAELDHHSCRALRGLWPLRNKSNIDLE